MKLVLEVDLSVERIGGNWETVPIGKNFTKRATAILAETSAVFIRGFWLIQGYLISSLNPDQIFFFNEDNRAGPCLAAPGTMARPHCGRRGCQLKFDGPTTTASFDHSGIPRSHMMH